MKILLIGKTGQLGGSILARPGIHQIYAPGRDVLDIEDSVSCAKVIAAFVPDVVINTAAFHNVPLCETEPLRALAINCVAARNLADLCQERGIFFVSFSSDYVFSGEQRFPYQETCAAKPLQMYGISRLAGEQAILTAAPEHAIVIRTCGLYGFRGAVSKGGNFVDKRIRDAQGAAELEMGCDQVVAPTFTDDLAQAVLQLIAHPQVSAGIYHLVNEGACTWFEFTKAIYELMEIDIRLIPVDRGGLSGKMHRPLYSVLANTKAQSLGIILPHWRDALQRYVMKKYYNYA